MSEDLKVKPPCILCSINSNQCDHFLVADFNGLRAVLDIRPITEGHLLILSRTHVSHLEELPPEEYRDLFLFTRQLGEKIIAALDGVNDYTLVVNNGKHSGQHIPHVHIHLIPRRKWDGLNFYWRLLTRFINPISSRKRLLRVSQQLKNSVEVNSVQRE